MVYGSWNYCQGCQKLLEQKLLPNFDKRPVIKAVHSCQCTNERYIVPRYKKVPKELRNLTIKQVHALRPFDVHLRDIRRHANGY